MSDPDPKKKSPKQAKIVKKQLTDDKRKILLNIYRYLERTSLTYPYKMDLYKTTAEIMEVSARLVGGVITDSEKCGNISLPEKVRMSDPGPKKKSPKQAKIVKKQLTDHKRKILLNIYRYLESTWPTYPYKMDLYKTTAEIMEVSARLVGGVVTDNEKCGNISLPEKMTIRWGIVSAAKISNDFVNAINSFPDKGDQAVVAIAARDRSRAEEFAKVHGIATVFDTYQAMAESTDVVDVVYIGALNPDHYALTKLFLENGKHVLCEKPLCLNLKQVQSLVKIARVKKRFLMEAVWSRFAPVYAELEKEIQKLGVVKLVEVNFGVPLLSVDRLNKKDLGGSAVLDLGVYVLQFAQFVFKDEPTDVTVVGRVNADGVDIVEHIILEYAGGRRAVLNVDATTKLWNKATVTGTKGRATVEEPFHFPETLIRVDGSVDTIKLHESELPYNFGNSAGLVYEALEVARCIREGLLESPRMSHRESLILAKLEDTVRKHLGVHYDVDDKEF